MKKFREFVMSLCVIALLCLCMASQGYAEYRIGVLAKRGEAQTLKKWGPTAEFLTQRLSERFVIVPLKFVEIEPAVKNRQIDFLLANSAFYVVMNEKYGARAVTTLMNSSNGLATYEFGGVILTRKDSNIRSLSQIKGKKFMCVKYSSFGGAHMAWRLLLESGIDPKTDCAEFLEGGTHDKVVMAVKNGTADVGTVRSDTLERMQEEGKINMNDFYVINQVSDSFPFVHSTRLYPVWPLAALPSTDPVLAKKVAKSLMLMRSSEKAAMAAKVTGWTYPANYEPVRDCLKEIRYGIFAN